MCASRVSGKCENACVRIPKRVEKTRGNMETCGYDLFDNVFFYGGIAYTVLPMFHRCHSVFRISSATVALVVVEKGQQNYMFIKLFVEHVTCNRFRHVPLILIRSFAIRQ